MKNLMGKWALGALATFAVGTSAFAGTFRVDTSSGFVPQQLTVQAGDTVVWVNSSSDSHTVTADPSLSAGVSIPAGAAAFNSGDLPPGASFSQTLTVPGTYNYVCPPHEQMGMVGTIVVQ